MSTRKYYPRRKAGRSMYKEETVDVEIDAADVIDYITDYASDNELDDIIEAVDSVSKTANFGERLAPSGLEGTLVHGMKVELLQKALIKYSLPELEERLGDLI